MMHEFELFFHAKFITLLKQYFHQHFFLFAIFYLRDFSKFFNFLNGNFILYHDIMKENTFLETL